MPSWLFDNAVIPKAAFLDADGNQILETISMLDIQVSPSKSFSQHKLESGRTVTDNVIDNQTAISIQAILSPDDYLEVYKELDALYQANTEFYIQTRVETYPSMYLVEMPHDESAKMASTIALNLNFLEQQIATVTTTKLATQDVANPSDTDATKSGSKVPRPSTTTLQDLTGYVGSFF